MAHPSSASRVIDILPVFAKEIEELLVKLEELELASRVPTLAIVDRCRCSEDFCASFYTELKPQGSYGAGHRNVDREPERGMIILDVVDGRIMQIEVSYRDEIRRMIQTAIP